MERLEERYIRWILGVDSRTPGYMVREEMQREKVRVRAGKRAWSWEKKMEEGKGSEIARSCWREMRKRIKEGRVGSKWKRERESYFEERGWKIEEVEVKREEGEDWFGEILKYDWKEQRKERREKNREIRIQ